jgi:Ala-tRNA(Pro) deacylase
MLASPNLGKAMSGKICQLHTTVHEVNNERNEMDISISRAQDSVLQLLSRVGCDFHVVEHAPVYTIEEAMLAVPPIEGIKTKNIFARDAKGVSPGAVSVFSLINDVDASVELIVDETIWCADKVQGHPLRNTATVSISHESLVSFLAHIDHRPRVIHVPSLAARTEHA